MEEISNLIFHGCRLVRDLETNMNRPDLLPDQPSMISSSCDEIVNVFSAARDRLISRHSLPYGQTHDPRVPEPGEGGGGGAAAEWLPRLGGSPSFQGSGVMDSGASSSSRRRKRRDEENDTKVRVPAPQMGNPDVPPDDGFTWRKYGQKEILGSRFPRAYYRCTHQKLCDCPAKKQVQRLDDDPFTFEVTYRGQHTCTAPMPPPPTTTAPHPPPPTFVPATMWLTGFVPRSGSPEDQVANLAETMFDSGSGPGYSLNHIFPSAEGRRE